MEKRGLTSTQVIGLFLAIVGFMIVLYFLITSDIFGQTPRDICHASVITRATAPSIGQSLVPLKCKTEKICLTVDSDSRCEMQFGKDKDVEVVVLKGSVQDMRTKIEEISANAMYDCWAMMGEGKLDLFAELQSRFGLDSAQASCVICSRVAADKTVVEDPKTKKSTNILYDNKGTSDTSDDEGVDINNYMKTHQIPGQSLTYLQAFTDRGVSSFSKVNEGALKDTSTVNGKEVSGSASGNQMAFIFMQIKAPDTEDVLKNMAAGGATIAGATFMTPVLGTVAKWVGRAVISTPAGFILTATSVVGVAIYGAYNAKQGQLAAGGYCGEFTSKEESQQGCSIVQGINYNIRDVNTICKKIEGEI